MLSTFNNCSIHIPSFYDCCAMCMHGASLKQGHDCDVTDGTSNQSPGFVVVLRCLESVVDNLKNTSCTYLFARALNSGISDSQ